jgi:hypothetical protein
VSIFENFIPAYGAQKRLLLQDANEQLAIFTSIGKMSKARTRATPASG